jgi:GGDEF domain-containing protein
MSPDGAGRDAVARNGSFEPVPPMAHAAAGAADVLRPPLTQRLRLAAAEITLPDRHHFRLCLEQRLQRGIGAPLALLYVEFDPEGEVEPSLDRIVALRLLHALRAEDVVGRMGHGEFACMLADVPGRHVLDHVAERLRAALEAPLESNPRAVVHAHIGIAVCPRDGATPGVLLKHADEASFRARTERSGHAFFDPRLDP